MNLPQWITAIAVLTLVPIIVAECLYTPCPACGNARPNNYDVCIACGDEPAAGKKGRGRR